MRQRTLRTAGAACLLFAAAMAPAAQKKDKDATLTVERIMDVAHGEGGLRARIAKAARAGKLADARKDADEWVRLAGLMAKETPVKGKLDAWAKHTATYERQVRDVAAVVKADKKDAVFKALQNVNCNGCHNAHKPN